MGIILTQGQVQDTCLNVGWSGSIKSQSPRTCATVSYSALKTFFFSHKNNDASKLKIISSFSHFALTKKIQLKVDWLKD